MGQPCLILLRPAQSAVLVRDKRAGACVFRASLETAEHGSCRPPPQGVAPRGRRGLALIGGAGWQAGGRGRGGSNVGEARGVRKDGDQRTVSGEVRVASSKQQAASSKHQAASSKQQPASSKQQAASSKQRVVGARVPAPN